MRPWPAALLLAFALVLQVLAGGFYRIAGLTPDFAFLALAYLSLFARPGALLVAAGATALVIDAISLDPLGTHLAGYLPALWLLNRFRRSFIAESALLRAALTLFAAWLAFLLEGAFLAATEGRWMGAGGELVSALYTGILGVAFHAGIDRYRAGLGWARDRYF